MTLKAQANRLTLRIFRMKNEFNALKEKINKNEILINESTEKLENLIDLSHEIESQIEILEEVFDHDVIRYFVDSQDEIIKFHKQLILTNSI